MWYYNVGIDMKMIWGWLDGGEHMTLTTMKRLKQELGFTNEWIAEKSGVPLGTVQKVFSEQVKAPRKDTIDKLSLFFDKVMGEEERDASMVHDTELAYKAIKKNKVTYRSVDGAIREEDGVYRKVDGKFTIEDLDYIPEDKRMELIDGVLYEMSAPHLDHQRILGNVFIQISECIRKCDRDCEVFFAPADVQVDMSKYTMVQPDLFIICDKDKLRGHGIYGAPDFVMEVLSHSTMKKDMTVKLNKYWNSGVREYWMIDRKNRKIIVYDFEHGDLNHQYDFDDTVPIGISEGKCSIDFKKVTGNIAPVTDDKW